MPTYKNISETRRQCNQKY